MMLLYGLRKKYYKVLGLIVGGFRDDTASYSQPVTGAFSSESPLEGWKKKHFEMLCDIADICINSGIPFFLYGETALCALRSNSLSDFPELCIDKKYFDKLIPVIRQVDKLDVKSMPSDKDCRQLIIQDTSSLDFDLRRNPNLRFMGLYITVYPIEECSRLASLKLHAKKSLKIFIKSTVYRFADIRYVLRKNGSSRNISRAFFHNPKSFKLTHPVNAARRLRCTAHHHTVICNAEYASSMFESSSDITIYDRKFFVPSDIEEFLHASFGFEWRKKNIRVFKESPSTFRDINHSVDEYRKFISYLNFDSFSENKRELTKHMYKSKAARIIQNRNKWLIHRTHERFLLWQEYMPQKDAICFLYKKGDMESLKTVLDNYLYKLKVFADKNLTIFFDIEIFAVAMEVLSYNGQQDLRKKIEKMVPIAHIKELKIRNYEGNLTEWTS